MADVVSSAGVKIVDTQHLDVLLDIKSMPQVGPLPRRWISRGRGWLRSNRRTKLGINQRLNISLKIISYW